MSSPASTGPSKFGNVGFITISRQDFERDPDQLSKLVNMAGANFLKVGQHTANYLNAGLSITFAALVDNNGAPKEVIGYGAANQGRAIAVVSGHYNLPGLEDTLKATALLTTPPVRRKAANTKAKLAVGAVGTIIILGAGILTAKSVRNRHSAAKTL